MHEPTHVRIFALVFAGVMVFGGWFLIEATNQSSAPAAPVPRPVVKSLVLAPAMPLPQPIGLPAAALTSAQAAATHQQHQSNLGATYKCQKSGRTSYSDQPCSSGDTTLAVTTTTKGTQRVIGDDLSQMKMQYAVSDFNPYTADSAIYRIEVPDPGSKRIGFGTGVLVAPDKILTNCHVLKSLPGWPRVVHRQTGRQFSVTKHYNLGNHDACILVGGFAGTPILITADIHEGQNVWIFGYPTGFPVVSQGTLKGLVDTSAGKSILSTAFCSPGSSGGPVVNSRGELVGLNWGVFRYQNQCLSIPASFLQPYLTAGG